MTTEEKRLALTEFCDKHHCSMDNCPLTAPVCKCGCGYTFTVKPGEEGYMTDDEINAAYVIAFPVKEPTDTTDVINHPKHYCREGGMESIDEMVAVFGVEATMHFCLCNVWKYRYRAGDKNGQEDLKKSDWYMRKYLELKGVLEHDPQ